MPRTVAWYCCTSQGDVTSAVEMASTCSIDPGSDPLVSALLLIYFALSPGTPGRSPRELPWAPFRPRKDRELPTGQRGDGRHPDDTPSSHRGRSWGRWGARRDMRNSRDSIWQYPGPESWMQSSDSFRYHMLDNCLCCLNTCLWLLAIPCALSSSLRSFIRHAFSSLLRWPIPSSPACITCLFRC